MPVLIDPETGRPFDPSIPTKMGLAANNRVVPFNTGKNITDVLGDLWDASKLAGLTPEFAPIGGASNIPVATKMATQAAGQGAKAGAREIAKQIENRSGVFGNITIDPRQNIIAWHGSPHTFEKFDLSKIGTGEGAQQYGWGAYLAEHPDVAKIYTPRDLKYEDKLLNLYNQAERVGNYPAMQVYEDLMIQKMPSEISLEGLAGKDLLQAKSALNQGTKLYQSQKGSNIYKVDLADESLSRMLNWDKPISEQSKEVQTAISPIVKTYGLPSSEKGSSVYQAANEIFGNEKKLIQQRDNLFNKYQKEGMSFSDAVKAMNPADRASFSNIADKIGNLNKNQEMSSKYLQKRGVTGIKYLDQLSRDTGNGTSNYVVFDPETIKILERNGLLYP